MNGRTDDQMRRRVMMTTDGIRMYRQRVLTRGLLLGRGKPPPESALKLDSSWNFFNMGFSTG
jgi:hypothetical protein